MTARGAARLLVAFAFALGGCSSRTTRPPFALPRAPFSDAVEVGDRLAVVVEGEEDLTAGYTVRPDGTLDLPLCGRVFAAGRSLHEIELAVVATCVSGRFLRHPDVQVVRLEAPRVVTVLGAVAHPTTIRYDASVTVVRAITLAGGLLPTADDEMRVTRTYASGRRSAFVSLRAIVEGSAPDVPLDPNDMIFVPERVF